MPTSLRSPAPTTEPPTAASGDANAWWPAHWALLAPAAATPRSAAGNMAVDLALLRQAAVSGTATLRLYRWWRPTISFGRNELLVGRWDVEAMRRDGFDVVRRPTGGRALLHLDDVTWSVTLPLSRTVPWRHVYAEVNARLCFALARLGIPVRSQPEADATPLAPDGSTCFSAPAVGELVVGDAKIGGSSVWREAGGYLQHGSLLLRDRQALLAAYQLAPHDGAATAPVPVPTATVAEWLPHVARGDRRRRVQAALWSAWPHRLQAPAHQRFKAAGRPSREPSFRVSHDARRLALLLAGPDWLWRR